MDISREDRESLIRDKYDGDRSADLSEDMDRLSAGEPLAYVIGWTPFLGLKIRLDSRPLIPRPETEWWTKELISHLHEKFGGASFTFLDLCAGSGAIGISILKEFPNARVCFSELVLEHAELIRTNVEENGLDMNRADIQASDLFEAFHSDLFDVIAANPPYIPDARTLPESVSQYEPVVALYSGSDGMELMRRIAVETKGHMQSGGELWMECDISNIEKAQKLLPGSEIRTDQYGRPRVLVGYF